MIEKLNSVMNSTLDQFHLIGFSLGAHVSGYAGATLHKLARITGKFLSDEVNLDFKEYGVGITPVY